MTKDKNFIYTVENKAEVISDLNAFNNIGKDAWRKEFFNSDYPDSCLISVKNSVGDVIGTQGFMSYSMNYYGSKVLAHRTERTLLSQECRGQGVFKKQVEIGNSYMRKRSSKFCFGTTPAIKAFVSAGFQSYKNYRYYDVYSINLMSALIVIIKLLFRYKLKDIKRIYGHSYNLVDFYTFLALDHVRKFFVSTFKGQRAGHAGNNEGDVQAKLSKLSADDPCQINSVSKKLNERTDGIFLYLDDKFFNRLSYDNYEILHLFLSVSEEGSCDLLLTEISSGYFKVLACSDYDFLSANLNSFRRKFKHFGISMLLMIRNKYRVHRELDIHTGVTRKEGFGNLVLIKHAEFPIADLEVEELWLML